MLDSPLREGPVAERLTGGLVLSVALLATGLGLGIERYTNLAWGNALPNPDVIRMFRPIAEGVAAGGDLYGPGLADNKPPGWQLLNVAAYETGEYTLVLLLCVGAANALTAILLWHWLSKTASAPVPVLASVLFLISISLVGGHHINSRSFALPFLVGALATTDPTKRGMAVAGATVFNTYAAVFVPAVLWLIWRESDSSDRVEASARYLLSGAGVGLAVFGGVGLVWGVQSTLAALAWSFGLPVGDGVAAAAVHPAADVPRAYLARLWPLSYPNRWLSYGGTVALQLAVVIVSALVGFDHRQRLGSTDLSRAVTVGLGAAAFPFLFRSYEQYWILPLPFLATFAALGVVILSETT